MAIGTLKNPRYYSGPMPELDSFVAVDTKTWKAGEWCRISTAGGGRVRPLTTSSGQVLGIFADSQATSTSTSTVKVYKITSTRTKFIGGLSLGAADVTAKKSMIGTKAFAHTASNVTTLVNSDTGVPIFNIVDVLWSKEPFRNDSGDLEVIFTIKSDSNLDVG